MKRSLPRSVSSGPTSSGTPSSAPHVCIVGGGFGGLYCALALQRYQRRSPQAFRITLIEPRDHFLFTPLLYEVLTDELKPWEIAPPIGICWARAMFATAKTG